MPSESASSISMASVSGRSRVTMFVLRRGEQSLDHAESRTRTWGIAIWLALSTKDTAPCVTTSFPAGIFNDAARLFDLRIRYAHQAIMPREEPMPFASDFMRAPCPGNSNGPRRPCQDAEDSAKKMGDHAFHGIRPPRQDRNGGHPESVPRCLRRGIPEWTPARRALGAEQLARKPLAQDLGYDMQEPHRHDRLRHVGIEARRERVFADPPSRLTTARARSAPRRGCRRSSKAT